MLSDADRPPSTCCTASRDCSSLRRVRLAVAPGFLSVETFVAIARVCRAALCAAAVHTAAKRKRCIAVALKVEPAAYVGPHTTPRTTQLCGVRAHAFARHGMRQSVRGREGGQCGDGPHEHAGRLATRFPAVAPPINPSARRAQTMTPGVDRAQRERYFAKRVRVCAPEHVIDPERLELEGGFVGGQVRGHLVAIGGVALHLGHMY